MTEAVKKMNVITENTGIKFTIADDGRIFRNSSMRVGNLVFLDFNCSCGDFSSWEQWIIGTAPKPIGNTYAFGPCILQNGSTAPSALTIHVTPEGNILVQNKSGAVLKGSWLFAKVVYVCQ